MKKNISLSYLCISFVLLVLASIGIIQGQAYQSLVLLIIVSLLWITSFWLYRRHHQWSYFPILLFVISWGIFPLMKYIAKFVLPWSADHFLLKIDQSIWAGKTLSAYFHYEDHLILSDIISACYFFFYFLVLGSVIYFAVYRKAVKGQVFFNAILFLYSVGFIGYILFPAAGPAFTILPQHQGGGVLTQFVTQNVNQGVTGMDVFPSLHTAISIFIVGYFFQLGHKKLASLFTPIVLGTISATIFLRYHYGIDVIVGILLALTTLTLTKKWLSQ